MQLVLPMFIPVLLTFITLFLMFVTRVKALKKKEVRYSYFSTYQQRENSKIPDYMLQPSRHFVNLLELPILFYIVCILFIQLNQIDSIAISLAWIFSISRVFHSLIHLTSNNINRRLMFYSFGFLVLILMWIYLIGKIYL